MLKKVGSTGTLEIHVLSGDTCVLFRKADKNRGEKEDIHTRAVYGKNLTEALEKMIKLDKIRDEGGEWL